MLSVSVSWWTAFTCARMGITCLGALRLRATVYCEVILLATDITGAAFGWAGGAVRILTTTAEALGGLSDLSHVPSCCHFCCPLYTTMNYGWLDHVDGRFMQWLWFLSSILVACKSASSKPLPRSRSWVRVISSLGARRRRRVDMQPRMIGSWALRFCWRSHT